VATLQLTQVYLEPEQKKALQERARLKGTKVAEEVRAAVDAYLTGVSSEELELLDAATREAKTQLDAMIARLDETNRKLDGILAEREQLHAARSVGRRSSV